MSEPINVPSCSECGARHNSVFSSMNSNQLIDLDVHKGCDFYKKGESIFKEGSFARALYFVNKGKIKLSKTGTSGKDQIIRFATEGDVLGYKILC